INWFTAADLGAKAVIFLEPDSTSRGQAERKFATLPVEMPRFYAPRATANAILVALGVPGAKPLASPTAPPVTVVPAGAAKPAPKKPTPAAHSRLNVPQRRLVAH